MRHAIPLCVLCILCGYASGHPVPSDNHDRTIVVRLTADALESDYRLEMDEARAARDLPKSALAGVGSRKEFHAAVERFHRTVLAENLDARLDGKPLDLVCVGSSHLATDHLRCDFRYCAAWLPMPGAQHVVTFREGNYELDDFSVLRLTLGAAGRVTLLERMAPDPTLIARPGSERKPGDGERLRTASATFTVAVDEPRGAYTSALPPDPDLPREGPTTLAASASRAAPAHAVALDKPGGPNVDTEEVVADSAPPHNLLHLLLDTRQGFGALLLLAAGFGAAHALTPGHGKTLAAAYLVGERGTVWHALLLGVVTTMTHTAAVLLLAALLPVLFPNAAPAAVQTVLGLAGGLLIAGLGLWLLMTRLAGRADHIHLGGGHHHHHHGHDHAHALPSTRTGLWGLVLLGISGGLVPCWDALAMLALAVSAQRLWLGLPLLLAFSAGLASVLVAVGIGVVYARNWAGARWGGWKRLRSLERTLPLISAAVVAAMGVWLCLESVPH